MRDSQRDGCVRRQAPVFLNRAVVEQLLGSGQVWNDPENCRAMWFGQVLTFSGGENFCWQPLWNNFLRGNLPLPQDRIIKSWPGKSSRVADLLKRNLVWTAGIIASDGKGNLWLHIPESVLSAVTPFKVAS